MTLPSFYMFPAPIKKEESVLCNNFYFCNIQNFEAFSTNQI